MGSTQDPSLVSLALRTLGSFDFSRRDLLPFVRTCVLMYLDDDTAAIRKEAALTCAQLLLQPGMVICVFATVFSFVKELVHQFAQNVTDRDSIAHLHSC
jgi:hypothetical protein